jgi:hypothetical protein
MRTILANETNRDGTGFYIEGRDGIVTGTIIGRRVKSDVTGIAFETDLTGIPRENLVAELFLRYETQRRGAK